MPINFPDSPTTNDIFTSGGKTWEYDGTAWTIKAATTSIATGLTGSTATDGSYKVTSITAGTGNVSWA